MILASALSIGSATEAAEGRSTDTMTVLTYNVRGLPWPLEADRDTAMRSIAQRLRAMRRRGTQPDVVLLQEAFTPAAKAIGRAAGYRYVGYGPAAEVPAPAIIEPADRDYLSGATYLAGERSGKHVGSGLAVFSDYPIVSTWQVAYPLCAGYDCLANKGILAVRLRVPGVTAPVTVVDTHLNSGKASGVRRDRSFYAYRRQVDMLADFIRTVVPPGTPLLVGGDFNVGRDPARRAHFAALIGGPAVALTPVAKFCSVVACGRSEMADVLESRVRNKDWLMFRATANTHIAPIAMSAPFGRADDGSMLSDHIGVAVTYRLTDRASRVALASR